MECVALMIESDQPQRIIRFPLPVSCKENSSTRFVKRITADSGETYEYEFDFVPNPTWEQFCGAIHHTCETCEWKSLRGSHYCPNPTTALDVHCEEWELSSESYTQANMAYYKALHEKHYGIGAQQCDA